MFSFILSGTSRLFTVRNLTAGALAASCICYIHKDAVSEYVRTLVSRVLQQTNQAQPADLSVYRSAFTELVPPEINSTNPSHTHPDSAAVRSSALVVGKSLAARLGMEPVVYQASANDLRNGVVSFSRSYYWHKDVGTPVGSLRQLGPNDLVIMVDVCYYVDMAAFLLNHDCPVFIYAFQPSTLAHVGEYSFCPQADNEFEYTVSGGGRYPHAVWNYGKDVLVVSNWISVRSYLVERRRADANHEYIFLVPIGRWSFLSSHLAKMALSAPSLSRFVFTFGTFAVADFQTCNGIYRSICKLGTHAVATLPKAEFDYLESAYRTAQVTPGVNFVSSWIEKGDENRQKAAVILEFLREKLGPMEVETLYPGIEGIRKYQIVRTSKDIDFEAKGLMVGFMAAIIPAAYIPDRSKNNERSAVQGRVTGPGDEAKEFIAANPPTKQLSEAMLAYIERLIPTHDMHKGTPMEYEDILKRQKRPNQVALLRQVENADDDTYYTGEPSQCKVFVKAEATEKPSDARLITTYPTTVKRDYAAYIYALADYVAETQEWYAFGKTPIQIAEIVAKICDGVPEVTCVDESRMDGHISTICRDFERMVLVRFFALVWRGDVIEKHKRQFMVRAKTTMGVKYDIETQRGSGSLETALFNTLWEDFKLFYANVMRGKDYDFSFTYPRITGGDDGLSKGFYPESNSYQIEAGKRLGLKTTLDVFRNGDPGVNFLSRVYTRHVWDGAPDSSCDLHRILSKLHVTVKCDVLPIDKLRQKLIGLRLSDNNTPIIRDIIITAMRLGMNLNYSAFDIRFQSWWAQYGNDNWPNNVNPCDVLEEQLPKADQSYHTFRKVLDRMVSVDQLLMMPALLSLDEEPVPEVKKPTAVDDRVVTPPPQQQQQPQVDESKVPPKATELPICTNFTMGRCKNGKACTFSHAVKQKCRFDAAGKVCRFANECKYAHSSRA